MQTAAAKIPAMARAFMIALHTPEEQTVQRAEERIAQK
jgi:hypothetical protein